MALPINIYLTPPYMAVSQTASIYNVSIGNQPVLTFGYMEQGNFNTVGYNVGDRILYPQPVNQPYIILSEVQYSLIDETTIILREPIDVPL